MSIKYDDDKPMPALVVSGFAAALLEVSKVATYGAKKYTEDGWRTVPHGEQRYTNAMLRHFLLESTGESIDDEGMMHAAAVAWNALARLELMLSKGDP